MCVHKKGGRIDPAAPITPTAPVDSLNDQWYTRIQRILKDPIASLMIPSSRMHIYDSLDSLNTVFYIIRAQGAITRSDLI